MQSQPLRGQFRMNKVLDKSVMYRTRRTLLILGNGDALCNSGSIFQKSTIGRYRSSIYDEKATTRFRYEYMPQDTYSVSCS